MKKCFFYISILLSLFFCGNLYAAPSISSTSGVWADGNSIVISGANLDTNALAYDWLGGTGNNIESGTLTNDFTSAKWTNYYGSHPTYSDVESHAGSQSILFDYKDDSTYNVGVFYDHGSTLATLYFTAWIKFVKNDDHTKFQWKNWRIKNLETYSVASAGNTGIIGDVWWTTEGWATTGGDAIQIYADGVGQAGASNVTTDAFLFDTWQRIEATYVQSTIDIANGSYEWRRIGRGAGEVIASNYAVMTHNSDASEQLWRYLLMGHGYYSVDGGTPPRSADIYYDDIYASPTQARVEIGDNSIFANCSHREIQEPTAWAAGEITFTLNAGSIANLIDGNHYLFVVDSAGAASSGFQLTGKSAALTGTYADGATEAETAAGTEGLIITLTNDTWHADVGSDVQLTKDLIAGIDSGGTEAAGWDAEIKGDGTNHLTYADITRTNDTTVTIDFDAEASYSITTNETITVTIPASALAGDGAIVASPTFEITATSDPVAALTGTLSDGATEAEIVAGGKTIIITLTNDTWVATMGDDVTPTDDLMAGIDSAQSETLGWDNVVKANMLYTDVTRDTDTQVTILLGAEATYDVSANETVTVTIPATAVTSAGEIVATPTINIVFFETSTEKIVGMTLQ